MAGVKNEDARREACLFCAGLKSCNQVGPAIIDSEILHVLHYEGSRLEICDDIEERPDVAAPGIIWLHTASH